MSSTEIPKFRFRYVCANGDCFDETGKHNPLATIPLTQDANCDNQEGSGQVGVACWRQFQTSHSALRNFVLYPGGRSEKTDAFGVYTANSWSQDLAGKTVFIVLQKGALMDNVKPKPNVISEQIFNYTVLSDAIPPSASPTISSPPGTTTLPFTGAAAPLHEPFVITFFDELIKSADIGTSCQTPATTMLVNNYTDCTHGADLISVMPRGAAKQSDSAIQITSVSWAGDAAVNNGVFTALYVVFDQYVDLGPGKAFLTANGPFSMGGAGQLEQSIEVEKNTIPNTKNFSNVST